MTHIDLTNKTAVVTGGIHGIGAAAVRALANAGAEVWVFDSEAAGERAIRVDVSDRASLEAAFNQSGDPDIVVANAGTVTFSDFFSTTPEDWAKVLSVNLTGTFHTVQLAAARMKQSRRGAIVITASTNSFDGESDLTAYNASKAGLLGLLHTAANELGPYGVRVNAVCPGLIRTRLTEPFFANPGIVKSYFQHIPLGRGGMPVEVANAILFLASDLASFITGVALPVDGGQMAAKFGTWNEDIAEFAVDRWRLK
jgi:NAD(P)-dependent dehydrogenase (short-subunit alcohol dehydrogenase family)